MKLPTIKRKLVGFKSPLEMGVWKALKKMTRGKTHNVTYETERLPYTLRRNYVPDFIVTRCDGRKIYIEAKGYLRQDDRAKLLAVRRDNPEVDLRMVFAKNNKISKKSKSRYSDWAKRHGIPCAIGEIPAEWLK